MAKQVTSRDLNRFTQLLAKLEDVGADMQPQLEATHAALVAQFQSAVLQLRLTMDELRKVLPKAPPNLPDNHPNNEKGSFHGNE